MKNLDQPKALSASVLLLDVEGTTTPIDFVYQSLFPYARAHLAQYLKDVFDPEDRVLLLEEYASERSPSKPAWQDPPITYLYWLMDQDRKSRGLKSVQGKIWERGYREGALSSVVYPDVALAMRHWRHAGGAVYIYSSGSDKAQRLLFGHTTGGDLTPLIDGFFDTEVGSKREVSSYRQIAARIGVPAGSCLFVSDVAAELQAAHDAGFQVLLSVRPGNPPQECTFAAITSFDELFDHVVVNPGNY